MAGKFNNTVYSDTVDSLLGTMRSALNNNFYKYSDKPPTPVEYFHINKQATSLDEGSKLAYNIVGHDSPLVYNQIHNMYIYGLDQISLNYTNEEFGMESSAIEGEAVILPNTITPYPDDQFMISYLNKQIVFRVTNVDPDTLEDGSNIYKITYRSDTSDPKSLLKQVVEEYEFVVSNVGTELNPVIKSSVLSFIKDIEKTVTYLKQYYINIFYSKRVQTFIFSYLNSNFYDPYLIEFIRKNKLLEGAEQYIYIQHQTTLSPLFAMNYMKTFFQCLEKKDKRNVESYNIMGAGRLIDDNFSIFVNRLEEYWEIYYDYPVGYEFLKLIPCFSNVLVEHIVDEKLIEQDYKFYNIIIRYMHDLDFHINDLRCLDSIKYENNPTLYYAIPCIIYCLEQYMYKLISVETVNEKHTNKA